MLSNVSDGITIGQSNSEHQTLKALKKDTTLLNTKHSARVISAGILVSAYKLFKLEPG